MEPIAVPVNVQRDERRQRKDEAVPGAAFRLTPGVESAVAHRGWSMARDEILTALGEGPCVVALLGAAGTGKTLLLAEIARRLGQEGWAARLYPRGDVPLDPAAGGILLVDEAARMGDETLEDVARSPGIRIVLAGLPGFADRLEKRATVRVVPLEPMTVPEMHAFVAAQLDQAAHRRDSFEPEAIERLASRSGGIPRVLNQLARAALFLAASAGRPEVTVADIEEAVALRDGAAASVTLPGAAVVPGVGASAGVAADELMPPPVPDSRAERHDGASVAEEAAARLVPERLVPSPPAAPPRPSPHLGRRRVALQLVAIMIVLAGIVAGSWTSWPPVMLLPRHVAAAIMQWTGAGGTPAPPSAPRP